LLDKVIHTYREKPESNPVVTKDYELLSRSKDKLEALV
jgi:hypothetical protein